MTQELVPKISVVVLNYNGLPYLRDTIPPLLRMEHPDTEIIVVDNHSADGSVAYIESLSAPRLKIIRNSENSGYCQGKNLGIENATGEFILLLDEDTKIDHPDILGELLDLYRRLPNTGFISLLLKENDDHETTKLYGGFMRLFSVYSNKPVSIRALMRREYHESSSPDGQAVFFKKTVFQSLGGYDTSQPYYIDVGDIGLRAVLFGYRNYVYTKRIFTHLGKIRKTNKEGWLWKYGYLFSGISRVMFKNYKLVNLYAAFPFWLIYCLTKATRNAVRYRTLRVFGRLAFSVGLFLRNLPDTLRERRRIQRSRTVPSDAFLRISPPRI